MEVIKEDFIRQARYVPRAIILFVILALAFLFIKDNNKEQIKEKLIGLIKDYKVTLFLLYLAFLLMSTIFSRWMINPYRSVLGGFGFKTDKGWNTQSIENVLLFIPYTFLYSWAFHPNKPWKAVIKLSLISSVTIELLQLIFWLGSFQFSDILHNFEGGMLGCILWCISYGFIGIFSKRQR